MCIAANVVIIVYAFVVLKLIQGFLCIYTRNYHFNVVTYMIVYAGRSKY